jgi:two-component system response regulator HydG
VILITATPDVHLVVRAIKAGVFDFVAKPDLDEARLYAAVSKAVAHGRLLARVAATEAAEAGSILAGTSAAMRAVMETLRMAAPTDATLLILGESGTGKELAARAAHRLSGREGELVSVNMAALPRELVESTLFGHERGAFTGADRRREGLCEQAVDGTLFFDEIGEMPLDLQAKLLRFIQERTFRRVGGTEEVRVDVRIVAATNRDLMEEVRDGRFREDLFYRLNTIPIEMPALRTRASDIAPLAMVFLREFALRYSRDFRTISAEAIARLTAHDWPGNVRELRQVIERAVVLHDAPEVTEAILPALLRSARVAEPLEVSAADDEPIVPLEEMERRAIARAMMKAKGSARDAAAMLGISLATLYRRLKP